jgi:hypothetical protein
MQIHPTGKLAALGLALLYFSAPLVHARDAAAEAEAGIAVPFMDGGIGTTEAAAMRKDGREFDLRMELSARRDNEFIADADLLISDMSGATVFALADAGPIVNLDLPAGRYHVSATRHGQTKSQLVNLNGQAGGSGKDLYFHWQGSSSGDSSAAAAAASAAQG